MTSHSAGNTGVFCRNRFSIRILSSHVSHSSSADRLGRPRVRIHIHLEPVPVFSSRRLMVISNLNTSGTFIIENPQLSTLHRYVTQQNITRKIYRSLRTSSASFHRLHLLYRVKRGYPWLFIRVGISTRPPFPQRSHGTICQLEDL